MSLLPSSIRGAQRKKQTAVSSKIIKIENVKNKYCIVLPGYCVVSDFCLRSSMISQNDLSAAFGFFRRAEDLHSISYPFSESSSLHGISSRYPNDSLSNSLIEHIAPVSLHS